MGARTTVSQFVQDHSKSKYISWNSQVGPLKIDEDYESIEPRDCPPSFPGQSTVTTAPANAGEIAWTQDRSEASMRRG